ncbi:MAG TPA: metal ABC transporter ATP-binding protein [Prolixibacteraceae bacterium]|nr:metal ABC transporter ATP-binding protein [Prolixibacteraceae bacterium]
MKPILEIKNLTVKYDNYVALEKANMIVGETDFIGVIGPNGGGKTTLLKAILGLITPTSGEIVFSDAVNKQKTNIGYLPQVNQFDHRFPIEVIDVVLSGLAGKGNWLKTARNADREKAFDLLDQLGMVDFARKPIGQLSGGQMQRVFLGRALISDPKLIILDEPGTYVDNKFESELYEKLRELNKSKAIILVSHDVGTIFAHVKSIACINRALNYHPSNIITPEQLASYNCPIQIITHGQVPHTVLGAHHHNH